MTTLTPEKFKELLLKGQLPKGPITVNGDLNLTNCKGLTALPENLSVNDGRVYRWMSWNSDKECNRSEIAKPVKGRKQP